MINEYIKPINALEERIILDPDFITGALWGKPRNGHPEGKIIYHIGEVLDNIEKYKESLSTDDYNMLRIISIIHDTFKYKVDINKPKHGDNHHAMYARKFAEKYIDDRLALDIIELHDEAYNSWQLGNRRGDWLAAKKRLFRMLDRFSNFFEIELYEVFYKCDGSTGDKKNDDYDWFINMLNEYNIK